MQIFEAKPENKLDIPVQANKVFQNEKIAVVQLQLKPQDEIGEHKNNEDALFHCIAGNPTAIVNGEEVKVQKGQFIFIKNTDTRAWKNETEETAVILAIKH